MIVGFGDRLLSEVKKITPKDIKIRVCIQYSSIMWNSIYILKCNIDVEILYTFISKLLTSCWIDKNLLQCFPFFK